MWTTFRRVTGWNRVFISGCLLHFNSSLSLSAIPRQNFDYSRCCSEFLIDSHLSKFQVNMTQHKLGCMASNLILFESWITIWPAKIKYLHAPQKKIYMVKAVDFFFSFKIRFQWKCEKCLSKFELLYIVDTNTATSVNLIFRENLQ